MDPAAARLLMTHGHRPLPVPDTLGWREAWFRRWLNEHRVTLSGLSTAAGLSRSTISSLAGSGRSTSWEKLGGDTLRALARAMNVAHPLSESELRDALKLPDPSVRPVTGIREVMLVVVGAVRVSIAVDPEDGRAPHVMRGGVGTYVSGELTSDERLGRLVSIVPA